MIIFRSHFSSAFEKNPVTTEELPDAYEKDARNRPPGFIPEGRSRYDRSTVPRNGKGRPTVPLFRFKESGIGILKPKQLPDIMKQ